MVGSNGGATANHKHVSVSCEVRALVAANKQYAIRGASVSFPPPRGQNAQCVEVRPQPICMLMATIDSRTQSRHTLYTTHMLRICMPPICMPPANTNNSTMPSISTNTRHCNVLPTSKITVNITTRNISLMLTSYNMSSSSCPRAKTSIGINITSTTTTTTQALHRPAPVT
jgi:hypothetical protein